MNLQNMTSTSFYGSHFELGFSPAAAILNLVLPPMAAILNLDLLPVAAILLLKAPSQNSKGPHRPKILGPIIYMFPDMNDMSHRERQDINVLINQSPPSRW